MEKVEFKRKEKPKPWPLVLIRSGHDVVDVINVMVVWCREVRVEAGRCDVVPFLRRDVWRSSVE